MRSPSWCRSVVMVGLPMLGLLTACGGPSGPALSPDQIADGRAVMAAAGRSANTIDARLLEDLRAHRKALGLPPAAEHKGVFTYFVGSFTSSQSPFDGSSHKVIERGLLAVDVNGETRFYDGEFFFIHPRPIPKISASTGSELAEAAINGVGAVIFLGHVETAGKPTSKAFGLYVADVNPVELLMASNRFQRAERDYIESFEKKQQDQVAKYKELIAERARAAAEASASDASAWSFGEALVVGLGGKLLATGNANVDELVQTGLKFGVRAARDGVDKAAGSVLEEQKARLTAALERAATQAKDRRIGSSSGGSSSGDGAPSGDPATSCASAWTCSADAQAGSMCKAACAYSGAQRAQTCEVLKQTFPKAVGCCAVCK